jgi:23S rRNA pseudouridine1911/1915/1917 synthase
MNQGWTYCDRIPPNAAGLTVLDYYSQRYRHSSRADWTDRITSGQIHLNNQVTTPETRLQQGQHLTYHRPPWQEPSVPLTFDVLHADPDIIVVAKPAGLPVLPGGGFLEHTLLGQLQRHYPNAFPIHRLGRGTSGLVLLACTRQARAHLSQQMRQRQITKVYRALVRAVDIPDQFVVTHPIGKLPHPSLGYVYGATSTGLLAESRCVVRQRRAETTLLDVTILTGRPHQIRIHLAAAGYPLLGDPLYGIGGIPQQFSESMAVPGDCGYHLHAHRLTFEHPSRGNPLQIDCLPPSILRGSQVTEGASGEAISPLHGEPLKPHSQEIKVS